MNLNERAIHPSHRQGFLQAMSSAIAVTGSLDVATRLLNALVAPGVTYAELHGVKERAVTRAIDRVVPATGTEIPETRVDALIDLFPLVTPDLRFCASCGALDLQWKAGSWKRVSGPSCTECQGILRDVAFDAGVTSWVDGRVYPPGTEKDENGIPLTILAVNTHIVNLPESQSPDALVIAQAMKKVDPTGGLTVMDVLKYMVRGPNPCTPVEALLRVVAPSRFLITTSPEVVPNFLLRVLAFKGARTAEREDGQVVTMKGGATIPIHDLIAMANAPAAPVTSRVVKGSNPVEPRQFNRMLYEALAEIYYDHGAIRQVILGVGMDPSQINFGSAAKYIWSDIVSRAESWGKTEAILDYALAENPTKFAKMAEGFLDMSVLQKEFNNLSARDRAHLVVMSTGHDFLGRIDMSLYDQWDKVSRSSNVVKVYQWMKTGGRLG